MRPTSGRRVRRLRPSLLVLLVGLAVSGGASAVAHAAGPIQLAEPGPFVDVAVADVPGGGYLLVWQDAGSLRLRARRVTPGGFPGPFLEDLPVTPFGIYNLAAAYSASGGWIVLWTQPSGADQVGIGGAVFDAQDRLVRLFELPDPIPDPGGLVISFLPHVAALPGGGFAVTVTVGVQDDPLADPLNPSDTDAYALRLDDGGREVGPAVRLNDDTSGYENATAVGASETGIVVTWGSWVRDGEDHRDTLVRVFGLDLSPLSAPIQVNENPILPQLGRGSGLAVGPDGRFVVAWEAGEHPVTPPPVTGQGADPREAASPGAPPHIGVRAFDAAGDPVSGETSMEPAIFPPVLAGVELDGDGVVWVGWALDGVSGIPHDPFFSIRIRPFDLAGEPMEPTVDVALVMGATADTVELTAGERGALVTWRPTFDSTVLVGEVVGLRPEENPPPPELALESPELPGFRVWVLIDQGGGQTIPGTREDACIPETMCVSGAVAGRSELFVRMVGPKPNGRLWPTLVKFSTSRIEAWIEQLATGEIRYYELRGARPGFDELPGLFDRHGFEP